MPEKASLSNPRNAFELFHKVYQAKDVTSQMHGIHCHVPEFLTRYQNIADFIQSKVWKNMTELLKTTSDPQITEGLMPLDISF